MIVSMAVIGPTFPPWKMPPQEAELDPASRSVVARLRVISIVIWITFTIAGGLLGASYAISEFSGEDRVHTPEWYRWALILVVVCSGAVGCFIGYLTKVLIDWARQVLVLLGHIAKR